MGKASAPTISVCTRPFDTTLSGGHTCGCGDSVYRFLQADRHSATLWWASNQKVRRNDVWTLSRWTLPGSQRGRVRDASFSCGVLDCADTLNGDRVNTYFVVGDQCDPTAWFHGQPLGAQADRPGCAEKHSGTTARKLLTSHGQMHANSARSHMFLQKQARTLHVLTIDGSSATQKLLAHRSD